MDSESDDFHTDHGGAYSHSAVSFIRCDCHRVRQFQYALLKPRRSANIRVAWKIRVRRRSPLPRTKLACPGER